MKMIRCLLGDIITFQRGYDLPRTKMEPGEYPVVGSNGIIGYHNQYTTVAPCITIGRSGNVGGPQIQFRRAWAHNTTLFIKEFKNVDPVFVYYLLLTLDLGNYAGGSAVPTLNRNHIHSLPITIPAEIGTQKRIAQILSSLDDKIEVNNQINRNLEEQMKAIFKSRFVDFEPFGGKQPDDWIDGTIADLGRVMGGGTPSKAKEEYFCQSGIPWITPKDLSVNKSKFISRGQTDISDAGLNNSSAIIMPKGTVLFSSRAPIGYIAIAKNDVTTNQGFKSVVPHPHVGTPFVYMFLKHNLEKIESVSSGSTFKEVSGGVMKSIPALIPDNKSLSEFTAQCQPLFQKQETLEEENNILQETRDTLLPKLMSGEIAFSEEIISKPIEHIPVG